MPIFEYRFAWIKGITPYAGIGPRVLFLKSTVQDNGMPAIECISLS